MAKNYGKEFEQQFKKNFLSSVQNSTLDRLYDVMNGYKSIKQVSDYICYCYPNIFYIELKSHHGASVPFDNITQYNSLLPKVGIPGVRCGVVLWLVDKEKVLYIPISTIRTMKDEGKKSVGISALTNYFIVDLPSVRKRVFLDTDYSPLMKLKDGQ